jgi:hypothetical protein
VGSLDLERERLSNRRVRGVSITRGNISLMLMGRVSVSLVCCLSIPESIAFKVSVIWLFSAKVPTISFSVAISGRLLRCGLLRVCLRLRGVFAQVLLYKMSVNYLFEWPSHPVQRVLNKKYLIGTTPALQRLSVRHSAHSFQLSLPQIYRTHRPRLGPSALPLSGYHIALRLCFSHLWGPCDFAYGRAQCSNACQQTFHKLTYASL